MSVNSLYYLSVCQWPWRTLRNLFTSMLSLLIGVAVCAPLASANTDIYVAKVALNASVTEQQAIAQAFVQVVTELTGSVASQQAPVIKQAQQTAADYVSHIATLQLDEDRQFLQIRFDQQALDYLLRQAGLPIWSGERANLIAWLVIERQGMQEVIGDDGHAEALMLHQQSELRGIPLLLPLMDLTDQSQVSVSDIGGRFWQPIEQASQRYQAQGIIIGRIYQTIDSYWHAQGQLKLPDGTEAWQLEAPQLDLLLGQLTEQLGAMLVQRYALQTDTNNRGQLLLQVQGITSLTAYADLLQLLGAISSVSKVQLVSLQADTLLLKVTHQGEAKKLLLSLELESRLALLDGQQANAYSASQSAHTAYYVWQ